MPAPDIAIPSRAPAEVSADDTVLPFEVSALDLRGRVVRLGPAVDRILEGHNYPQPVAKLLGEAIVLGALLGTALKFEGRFILQTKTDGPVPMLVVDFTTPNKVRACARLDKNRVAEAIATGKTDAGSLLGRGHLAMTVDQGGDMSRYQGLVALDGGTLEDAAHEYFLRSEQIPTRVRRAGAAGRATVGAPAVCCCSSCHARRSGRAFPISIPATPRKASRSTSSPKTMPGSRDARSPRRSRTSNWSTRHSHPSGCSIACSTSAACGCSVRSNSPRNAPARARVSRRCCARSRNPTATTWWRTASSR